MPAMEMVATSIQYCATGGLTTWVCAEALPHRQARLPRQATAPSVWGGDSAARGSQCMFSWIKLREWLE